MIKIIDSFKEYEVIAQTTYYIRNKKKNIDHGIFSDKKDALQTWKITKRVIAKDRS